ncbi:hypothetical protein BOTBODRAFT_46745 [Botryobasidium botryosum FD-172 SS1]|uniref:Uncharacterized protein n=1 Tax=Botryobasidium botryosum (strain FD-172 SS1) TaxID=930990 RepID=A0A067MH36_BOTB1|nr:hypothetical protein BOTBODRAFT_46745 [Botryobasidium botryosum FD-172 SS1]
MLYFNLDGFVGMCIMLRRVKECTSLPVPDILTPFSPWGRKSQLKANNVDLDLNRELSVIELELAQPPSKERACNKPSIPTESSDLPTILGMSPMATVSCLKHQLDAALLALRSRPPPLSERMGDGECVERHASNAKSPGDEWILYQMVQKEKKKEAKGSERQARKIQLGYKDDRSSGGLACWAKAPVFPPTNFFNKMIADTESDQIIGSLRAYPPSALKCSSSMPPSMDPGGLDF